jgi:RNA polymerase-binding transcription factor DksA
VNKAPAKKAPVKKQVAKTQPKKAPVKKVLAKQAPARKAPVKKAPAVAKASANKVPAKTQPKQAPVKKVLTKQAPAKKAPPTKSAATKAPAFKASATKTPATKTPATKTPATKTPATKTPATKTTAAKQTAAAPALVVDKTPVKVVVEKKAPPPKKPSPGYRKDLAFLERQKQALLEERASRLAQEQSQKQEAAALVEEMEPGDIQFDEESGEGGTLAVDREIHLELAAKQRLLVEEIDLALRKIALGTYGICERCENLIPKTRLTAIPEARICVPCSAGGLSRR